MSYFTFLAIFLLVPILLLLGTAWGDRRIGRQRTFSLRSWPIASALAIHVVVALLYTTPWDNYLVATRVWYYDPALVTGFTLGWVPIEEYTFFILQPILGGLWLLFLARRNDSGPEKTDTSLRRWLTIAIGFLWFASLVLILSGWMEATYLSLELLWALPPIGLQLAFGADILWHHRKLVLMAIVPLTLYLSAADALAIQFGTWTINPEQSLNIFIGGILPVEEAVFFLLTNTLVVFGLVLIWSRASQLRLASLRTSLSRTGLVEPAPAEKILTQTRGQAEEIQAAS